MRKINPFLQLRILLSHPLVGFGLLFGGISLFVSFFFIINMDINDLFLRKKSPITQGVVISVERTDAEVNDYPVLRYKYSYRIDGKKYQNQSYSTKKLDNDTVLVQYLKSKPEVSRILGMHAGKFSPWFASFLLIFIIIGGVLFYIGIKKTIKYLAAVKRGQLTYGTFSHKEATNTEINDRRVYKIFFNFSVNNSEYTAIAESHITEKFLDEKLEPIVYNPKNPNENVVLDQLPKAVREIFEEEKNNSLENLRPRF